MLNEIEESKRVTQEAKKENKKGGNSKKSVKVEFDMSKEEEIKSYEKLWRLHKRLNRNMSQRAIMMGDILKVGLSKISDNDLLELKKAKLTHKSKIALWTQKFNEENKMEIGTDEFMAEVLPALTPKEVKKLQEVSL